MTEPSITDDDIRRLVSEFYSRVRADELLGPIFNGAIDDWPEHLWKLQDFWSSVMLATGRYKGHPMGAHLKHHEQMTPEAFERWLGLWRQTTTDVLSPEAAEAFQATAGRIAQSFQLGVQFYREQLQAI